MQYGTVWILRSLLGFFLLQSPIYMLEEIGPYFL